MAITAGTILRIDYADLRTAVERNWEGNTVPKCPTCHAYECLCPKPFSASSRILEWLKTKAKS